MDSEFAFPDAPVPAVAKATPSRPLRLWVPLVALAIFLTVTTLAHQVDLSMFVRFISRAGANAALLLLLIGWWLCQRRFTWRRRFLVLGAALLWLVGASLVAHRSVDWFGMLLTGLQFVAAIGLAWLFFSRSSAPGLQVAGLCLVPGLVFGTLAMMRWDGIDGRQRSTFHWRWSLSAEERFLTSRASTSGNSPDTNAGSSGSDADASSAPLVATASDWPAFRGGDHESSIVDLDLSDWKSRPPTPIWRQRIGPGWSSMAIVAGHVFTQEQRGEMEVVACYNARTGSERWVYSDKARFEESLAGAGPRGTPTFADGRVYAIGATGRLHCLAADTGRKIWSRELVADPKKDLPQWGVACSPLVVGERVVAYSGGSSNTGLVALDAVTGEPVWSTPATSGQTYSSPQLMVIRGLPQIVMHDNRRLHAVDITDGKVLWEYQNPNEYSVPMLQPHPVDAGDLVVAWDAGVARFSVEQEGDQWTVKQLWHSKALKPEFNEFVIHAGHVYGLDAGILACIDIQTGKREWKAGRYGFGQMIAVQQQQRLIIVTETGDVVLVAMNPKKHEELGRFSAIQGKCWNHPAFADGLLLVRNGEEITALAP